MGLLGFDEKIRYRETNRGKREINNRKNANIVLEELRNQKEIDKFNEDYKRSELSESYAANSVNKRRKDRYHAIKESNLYKSNLRKEMVVSFLTESTVNGLVFDQYFIDDNKRYLREVIKEQYSKLYDAGIVTEQNFIESSNILMEDVILEMDRIIDKISADKFNLPVLSESDIYEIITEAPKSKEASDTIADTVKEKVTDTIEKENDIAKKNKKKDVEEKEEKEKTKEELDEMDPEDETDGEDTDTDSTESEDSSDDLDSAESSTEDNDESEETDDGDMSDDSLEDTDGDSSTDESSTDDEMSEDDTSTDMESSTDDTSVETSTDGEGKVSFTFSTDAKKFNFTINKENADFFIGSRRKIKAAKNESSLFKNILTNSMKNIVMNESAGSKIDMDIVMSNAIITYSMLECLNTSRLIDFKAKDVQDLNRALKL